MSAIGVHPRSGMVHYGFAVRVFDRLDPNVWEPGLLQACTANGARDVCHLIPAEWLPSSAVDCKRCRHLISFDTRSWSR